MTISSPVRASDRRRRERTSVPGVYRRGSRFVAVYRDARGSWRQKFYETLDEAVAGKRALERAAWDVRLARRRQIRRKAEARIAAAGRSVDDAYLALRRTIATLSIANESTSGAQRRRVGVAIARLYAVEDDLVRLMREFPG